MLLTKNPLLLTPDILAPYSGATLSGSGRDFFARISHKYRFTRKLYPFPLYFLKFQQEREPVVLKNFFTYSPVVHFFHNIRFSLIDQQPAITHKASPYLKNVILPVLPQPQVPVLPLKTHYRESFFTHALKPFFPSQPSLPVAKPGEVHDGYEAYETYAFSMLRAAAVVLERFVSIIDNNAKRAIRERLNIPGEQGRHRTASLAPFLNAYLPMFPTLAPESAPSALRTVITHGGFIDALLPSLVSPMFKRERAPRPFEPFEPLAEAFTGTSFIGRSTHFFSSYVTLNMTRASITKSAEGLIAGHINRRYAPGGRREFRAFPSLHPGPSINTYGPAAAVSQFFISHLTALSQLARNYTRMFREAARDRLEPFIPGPPPARHSAKRMVSVLKESFPISGGSREPDILPAIGRETSPVLQSSFFSSHFASPFANLRPFVSPLSTTTGTPFIKVINFAQAATLAALSTGPFSGIFSPAHTPLAEGKEFYPFPRLQSAPSVHTPYSHRIISKTLTQLTSIAYTLAARSKEFPSPTTPQKRESILSAGEISARQSPVTSFFTILRNSIRTQLRPANPQGPFFTAPPLPGDSPSPVSVESAVMHRFVENDTPTFQPSPSKSPLGPAPQQRYPRTTQSLHEAFFIDITEKTAYASILFNTMQRTFLPHFFKSTSFISRLQGGRSQSPVAPLFSFFPEAFATTAAERHLTQYYQHHQSVTQTSAKSLFSFPRLQSAPSPRFAVPGHTANAVASFFTSMPRFFSTYARMFARTVKAYFSPFETRVLRSIQAPTELTEIKTPFKTAFAPSHIPDFRMPRINVVANEFEVPDVSNTFLTQYFKHSQHSFQSPLTLYYSSFSALRHFFTAPTVPHISARDLLPRIMGRPIRFSPSFFSSRTVTTSHISKISQSFTLRPNFGETFPATHPYYSSAYSAMFLYSPDMAAIKGSQTSDAASFFPALRQAMQLVGRVAQKHGVDKPPSTKTPTKADAKNDIPQIPGFDAAAMQTRYSSTFTSQILYSTGSNITFANMQVSLPSKNWKTLEPQAAKRGPTPSTNGRVDFLKQPGSPAPSPQPGAKDLGAMTFQGMGKFPFMAHYTPEPPRFNEEDLKKISQKVTKETQKFKSAVAGKVAAQSQAVPGVDLSKMADNVYKLIVDKVKKERAMRGY